MQLVEMKQLEMEQLEMLEQRGLQVIEVATVVGVVGHNFVVDHMPAFATIGPGRPGCPTTGPGRPGCPTTGPDLLYLLYAAAAAAAIVAAVPILGYPILDFRTQTSWRKT